MLFFTSILALYATQSVVMAQSEPLRPDADGRYTLEAEGIKAQFIPYGATLTNLFVKGATDMLNLLQVTNAH